MHIVVCKKDGWQHFAVTRKYAEEQVKTFNDWYEKQSQDIKRMYGGPSRLEDYSCQLCGGTDFREFIIGIDKQLYGSTIGPVIYES